MITFRLNYRYDGKKTKNPLLRRGAPKGWGGFKRNNVKITVSDSLNDPTPSAITATAPWDGVFRDFQLLKYC